MCNVELSYDIVVWEHQEAITELSNANLHIVGNRSMVFSLYKKVIRFRSKYERKRKQENHISEYSYDLLLIFKQ